MLPVVSLFLAAVLFAGLIFLILQLKRQRDLNKAINIEKVNYENICQQANDGMLVIDIADGRIHASNLRISEMLGYSPEKLRLLSLFNLHPSEMLTQSSERIADVWEKGGMVYRDLPFVTATGELLPVECSARVAPFAERPAIVIYARDIRERLRMESDIEKKNKAIRDSINYAKRIQQAMLPLKEEIKSNLPDSFILFKPKDVVSGDFYWFSAMDDDIFIAAADCTGHGVPGALMSMIGNSFLNEIVNEKRIREPAVILDTLRENIVKTLRQRGEERDAKDGMDIALCRISKKTLEMQFAGAFNPLYLIHNGELTEVKGDRFPIGYTKGKEDVRFQNHNFQLKKGDLIYLFTDGYADQFGGPKEKKFMYKHFKEMLLSIREKSMTEQKEVLDGAIEEWKGSLEQLDDILVIGCRI
jgi:PAS domain S-box-containing protein